MSTALGERPGATFLRDRKWYVEGDIYPLARSKTKRGQVITVRRRMTSRAGPFDSWQAAKATRGRRSAGQRIVAA
ncbi:MAG TPA: hypothetical protein VFD92_04500 [Candidatus Binatia bacterium]|nr:hypothetical protein [Candidatus Binatia bacterium]